MIKESGDSSRQELTVKATFVSPPATVFVLCVLFLQENRPYNLAL